MKKISILVLISLISFSTYLLAEESAATAQTQTDLKDSNTESAEKPDPKKVAAFAESVRAKLKEEGVIVADKVESAKVDSTKELAPRVEMKEEAVKAPEKTELPEVVSTNEQARAELKDADGQVVGKATLIPVKKGVKIKLEITSLPPGEHAFHVHDVGACSDAEFKSAGPHFNPEHKQHGVDNPEGHHMGDLPNVFVDENGKGNIEAVVEGAIFGEGPNSLFDADGTSIVLHGQADDHVTDPAGNAGKRIACGVITK